MVKMDGHHVFQFFKNFLSIYQFFPSYSFQILNKSNKELAKLATFFSAFPAIQDLTQRQPPTSTLKTL